MPTMIFQRLEAVGRRVVAVTAVAFGAVPTTRVLAQGPTRLDTVVVVASRTHGGDASRSVDVITHDQIARSAARTIADVLAHSMSMDVYGRSPAQADVSIRGSSPEQTAILVDGVDILQYDMEALREFRRHKISMVFQSFGLLPHKSVLDNVAYGLKVRGETKEV